jgi:hypothetical protein
VTANGDRPTDPIADSIREELVRVERELESYEALKERRKRLANALHALEADKPPKAAQGNGKRQRASDGKTYGPSDSTREIVLAVLSDQPRTIKGWSDLVGDALSQSAVRDTINWLRAEGVVRACGKIKENERAPHKSETYALMPGLTPAGGNG